ncbi:DNA damage-regulated autophagy modulator protein 1-like [Haliotis rubra]|uniref:DNA damage-regulated autophagy modulator protein 1-like n=1 Tax=Haliotis rubra TaxID=36100 RepID=UPI001EE57175|nr:DNA damage-regulated autophagy modulator protein 1-like [Haliotis rubra]
MTCKGEILPIVLLISLPVFCFITYGIAVSLGHVNARFPYISDTGTHPPESCVFGFLQGLYAFLSVICVYIRYCHVKLWFLESGRKILHCTNVVALIVGMISALGVYLVANFQETNVLPVHLLGAFLAFAGGNVYCWIQTIMTFRMRDLPGHRDWLRHFRLILTIIHLMSLLLVVIESLKAGSADDTGATTTTAATSAASSAATTAATTLTSTKAAAGLHADITPKWDPSMPGYSHHIASTAMEWVLAIVTAIYFCTFFAEFKHFKVSLLQIHYSATFEVNNMIEEKQNGVMTEVRVSTIQA